MFYSRVVSSRNTTTCESTPLRPPKKRLEAGHPAVLSPAPGTRLAIHSATGCYTTLAEREHHREEIASSPKVQNPRSNQNPPLGTSFCSVSGCWSSISFVSSCDNERDQRTLFLQLKQWRAGRFESVTIKPTDKTIGELRACLLVAWSPDRSIGWLSKVVAFQP